MKTKFPPVPVLKLRLQNCLKIAKAAPGFSDRQMLVSELESSLLEADQISLLRERLAELKEEVAAREEILEEMGFTYSVKKEAKNGA